MKNICAPAAVIDDKIYIVGGKKFFFCGIAQIVFMCIGLKVTVK